MNLTITDRVLLPVPGFAETVKVILEKAIEASSFPGLDPLASS